MRSAGMIPLTTADAPRAEPVLVSVTARPPVPPVTARPPVAAARPPVSQTAGGGHPSGHRPTACRDRRRPGGDGLGGGAVDGWGGTRCRPRSGTGPLDSLERLIPASATAVRLTPAWIPSRRPHPVPPLAGSAGHLEHPPAPSAGDASGVLARRPPAGPPPPESPPIPSVGPSPDPGFPPYSSVTDREAELAGRLRALAANPDDPDSMRRGLLWVAGEVQACEQATRQAAQQMAALTSRLAAVEARELDLARTTAGLDSFRREFVWLSGEVQARGEALARANSQIEALTGELADFRHQTGERIAGLGVGGHPGDVRGEIDRYAAEARARATSPSWPGPHCGAACSTARCASCARRWRG